MRSIKTADISLCLLSLPDLINFADQTTHAASFIPPDVHQHFTPNTLVLLNKQDLLSPDKTDILVTARNQLRLLTPNVWTGSVQGYERGGMDDFMEGLVDVLKERCA